MARRGWEGVDRKEEKQIFRAQRVKMEDYPQPKESSLRDHSRVKGMEGGREVSGQNSSLTVTA